ncbi:S-layer homology domain-containing protein [Paenibacillus sp. GSMTC-2017]|nr:S-layer homology domain-containing protein [Paenibacillus sp. GSMTC-2017]
MGKIKPNKLALVLAVAMVSSAMSVSVSAQASSEKPQQVRAELKDVTSPSSSPSPSQEEKETEQKVNKEDLSKEEAEKLFRQYVNIPKDYVLQSSRYGSARLAKGVQTTWSMDFVKRVNSKHIGSIYVTMSAKTGQLLNYNSYTDNPNAKPSYPLKVNRADAQKLATAFIDQIAKDYVTKVKFNEKFGVQLLPPLSGEVRHTLRYDRIVNGIPYLNNYIQLEINSEGHVLNFELNWDDSIVFPVIDKKLTLEQAKEKIAQAANPELRYIIPYNAQNRDPRLSYRLNPFSVQAITGEKLKDSSQHLYFEGEISDKAISEKPLAIKPKETSVTETQARKIIEDAFVLPANSEFVGTSFSEYRDDTTGKTYSYWSIEWNIKKDGKHIGSISANVNGSTGLIQNYNEYSDNSNASTANVITYEKAVEKAVETMKKQLPWLTNELYLIEKSPEHNGTINPEEVRAYSVEFAHKVHGAIIDYDRISVSINAKTGNIQYYDVSIAPSTYPEKAPVTLNKDIAVERWLDYYDIDLTYRVINQYIWNGKPIPSEKYYTLVAAGEVGDGKIENEVDVQLVYQLTAKPSNESLYLDAVTGNWHNWETGDITQLELPSANDISGHWAEQSLQLMVAYKALDLEEGNVRPNEGITRGEMIKMLILARNNGGYYEGFHTMSASLEFKNQSSFKDVAADSSYFAYIESALQQNLIDLGDGTFNPDAKVTRDEMSELIVRALGYNALANYDHIFKASFKDSADIQNKGQAAVVVGLKIMSLSDGKFLPKKQVTRAEASVAFFRYLQSRSELQEAPLRM